MALPRHLGLSRGLLACALVLSLTAPALANEIREGTSFEHHDWDLACDNTRTCRAAGYHSNFEPDKPERLVSVLLTRPRGPNAAVSGKVRIYIGNELEEGANHP